MMLNFGFLGLGFMAATHLKALRSVPDTAVKAICNPSGRNLDGDLRGVTGNVGDPGGVQLDMSGIAAYRDPAALFADPTIHVVDITTPTKTHVAYALAALEAGKHVLLEKPVARTAAEAWVLGEAAAKAAKRGVFLMPAMCLRFWSDWVWMREAVASGRFGRVLSARFRRVAQPPGWGHSHFLDGSGSGGALLDLHIHDVDFIQFCFGPAKSVVARGHTKVSGAVDHVMALYEVGNGAVVSAEGSWAMTDGFGFSASATINFERATVDYDLARGPDALKLFEPGQAPRVVQAGGSDGYVGEIAYFAECIRRGVAPTTVTAMDGVRALAVIEAEAEAIRTGREVAVA
jgi:predicted dehydrogenase